MEMSDVTIFKKKNQLGKGNKTIKLHLLTLENSWPNMESKETTPITPI
jgi:hypothetical protein